MPKIVDRDAMQAEIIEAAFRCFARQGFHETKMADIAREAGLAKGTLYLYFRSKDALAVALVKARFAGFSDAFDAPAPASLDAFLAGIRDGLARACADAGATRLLLDLLGPGFANDAVRAEIGAFFDRLGAVHARHLAALAKAGALRPGVDCAATGAALATMLDGLVIHGALFGPDDARHAAALALIEAGLRP